MNEAIERYEQMQQHRREKEDRKRGIMEGGCVRDPFDKMLRDATPTAITDNEKATTPFGPATALMDATVKGWECPKCGGVYAPWCYRCDNCKPEEKEDVLAGDR